MFDVVQQIFQGRLDRTLDRQLAESVFIDGRLCQLILEGQKRNDEAAAARTNMRLGYMGHLSLISEAVVKLFERYPDLAAAVSSSVPQPEWDEYVATTLRQARERDMTSLSNPGLNLSTNKAPSASSLSDEDDEFPMNSSRTGRATDAVVVPGPGSREIASASGDQVSRSSSLARSPASADTFFAWFDFRSSHGIWPTSWRAIAPSAAPTKMTRTTGGSPVRAGCRPAMETLRSRHRIERPSNSDSMIASKRRVSLHSGRMALTATRQVGKQNPASELWY